jgi:DNA-binding transcriptional LysR family regulator
MELRHLRHFLVLSEELHFGRAAQRLAMSQPPLSVSIVQLEGLIGARLFERNSRGVRLTPAGAAFMPEARAILGKAEQAAQLARNVAAGQTGTLSVGFTGTALFCGLPQMLAALRQTHPQMHIALKEQSSREQISGVLQERLDVGFVHAKQLPPGCVAVPIAHQRLCACLPADHRLAQATVLDLAQLQDEALALVSAEVSPDYHDAILHLCAACGWRPEHRHELRHWLSVVALVAQGVALALVPEALQQSNTPGVVFVPLLPQQSALLAYETHCIWRAQSETPALRAFVQAVTMHSQSPMAPAAQENT